MLLTFWPAVEDDDKKVHVRTMFRVLSSFLALYGEQLMFYFLLRFFVVIYYFQVAGIILAVIFLLHGLLAVGFKVFTKKLSSLCVNKTVCECPHGHILRLKQINQLEHFALEQLYM